MFHLEEFLIIEEAVVASLENHSTRVLHLSSFLMKKPKSKLLLNLTVKEVNGREIIVDIAIDSRKRRVN